MASLGEKSSRSSRSSDGGGGGGGTKRNENNTGKSNEAIGKSMSPSSTILFRQPEPVVVPVGARPKSTTWRGSRKSLEEGTLEKKKKPAISAKHSKADTNTLIDLLRKSIGGQGTRRRTRSSTSTTSSVSSLEEVDDKNSRRDRSKKDKGRKERSLARKKKKLDADIADKKGKKSKMGPHNKGAVKEDNNKTKRSGGNQVTLTNERRKAVVEMTKGNKGTAPGNPGITYERVQNNYKGVSHTQAKGEFPLPSSTNSTNSIKNYRIPKTKTQDETEPRKPVSRKRSINAGSGSSPEEERRHQTFEAIMKTDNASPASNFSKVCPGINYNKIPSDWRKDNSKRKRLSRNSPVVEDLKMRNADVFTFRKPESQPRDTSESESMEWEIQLPEIFRMVTECYNTGHPTGLLDGDGDVEMEEMDVDIDPVPNEQLVIVPDTNIFISCLRLMRNLVDSQFSKVAFPTIVIPWMVLQELDYLMHNNSSTTVKTNIRPAVNMIHSFLSNRHPRVKGQRAAEALISKHKFDELVADDSILNCAIQLKSSNAYVVFLTNDRNLRNKAMVNGVIACDSDSVFKTINLLLNEGCSASSEVSSEPARLPDITYQSFSPANRTETLVSHSQNSPFTRNAFLSPNGSECFPSLKRSAESNVTPSFMGEMHPQSPKVSRVELNSSSTEVSKVLQELLETFSYIIKYKMIEDFGENGWEYALKIKPPWTFRTAVKCILTHWLANFSYVFHRKGEDYFEKLSQYIQQYERSRPDEKSEIERNIVEACLSIFNLMTSDVSNLRVVSTCRKTLMDFATANGY